MPPILCVVGRSGTGKTTLMEKLVPVLKGRGYRIAVVKHTHKEVEWDAPGKDSWRMARAGSDAVLLCSGSRIMTTSVVSRPPALDEVLSHLVGEFDLVLVEGFHQTMLPRIEVHRRELRQPLRSPGPGLLAVATDEPLEAGVPQFALDDAAGIVDLIVRDLRILPRKPVAEAEALIAGSIRL